MTKNPQKYLYDIVEVGARLSELLVNVSLLDYEDDIEIQESVERKIEKIAEASYKLKTKFNIELSLADKIYNFRGSLVHQYDEIKSETIYKFATYYVPQLVAEADGLMGE
ncbi:MAG: hypothetical protein KDD99_13955 [Bacteroidetes bacterium]|nr:hypothetical protein [Bacteroidota bacterium]